MKPWVSNNLIPAMIWVGYHAVIPTWHPDFFSALMLLRAAIVLGFFLIRDNPIRRSPRLQIIIAWASTFLPTLMVWSAEGGIRSLIGELIAVAGITFFIFTCLDLGKSFGISPSVRPYVERGAYGWIPHPMYLSHVVVEVGLLVASPTVTNFAVVGLAWVLYALRAKWEMGLHMRYARVTL